MFDTIAQHNERISRLSPSTVSPIGIGIAKSMTVKVLELELTPGDALNILKRVHPKQRTPNKNRVAMLLATMRAGKWYEPPFTADSIAFDSDGFLTNGRHRMVALSQYDKPLRFFALFGVKAPDDMPLPECDNNLPRSGYFVEGKERDRWGVATFFVDVLNTTKERPPRFVINEMYETLLPAMEVLPRYRERSSQPVPVRAGFVFQWLRADAVERAVIEEQWKAINLLEFDVLKKGTQALYKTLQNSPTRNDGGSSVRILQFAQTFDALNRIDTATIIKKSTDEARNVVREYFKAFMP